MRIAFVGNFQYSCGSSNALLGYTRAGLKTGHDVRVSEFGYIDNIIRSSVPVASRNWEADLLVIVYESYPFLSNYDIDEICKIVPRSKRILLDPDGKYLEPRSNDFDTNHPTPDSYKYWTNLYDSLSDVILQPFLGSSKNRKIHPFLYFGMDSQVNNFSNINKEFDLLYVGNNWYRWHDISWLINAVSPIRSKLKKVALIGGYWSGEPMKGFEEATRSDPRFLEKNRVEIYPSARYGQVELSMSYGKLHPILVRPILNEIGFITPRMFETFVANTVPLIPYYFTHAKTLYGDEISELIISKKATDDILRIFDGYEKYIKLSREIRERLKRDHSYEVRLNQLIEYI